MDLISKEILITLIPAFISLISFWGSWIFSIKNPEEQSKKFLLIIGMICSAIIGYSSYYLENYQKRSFDENIDNLMKKSEFYNKTIDNISITLKTCIEKKDCPDNNVTRMFEQLKMLIENKEFQAVAKENESAQDLLIAIEEKIWVPSKPFKESQPKSSQDWQPSKPFKKSEPKPSQNWQPSNPIKTK